MIIDLRKKAGFCAVLSILMLTFIACGGGGDSDNGVPVVKATVSGTVLDSNDDPVSGALVTITSTPVTTYTDNNGGFSAQVEVGDHTITVTSGSSTVYQGNFSVSDTAPVNLGDLTPTSPFSAMNNADLSGTFFGGEIRVESGIGQTTAMTVEYDGAGNLTSSIIADSQGDSGSDNTTYAVAGDGGLSVGSSAPGESIRGQISSGGDLFSLVDVDTTGDDVGISFGIMRSTGMTNSDFNGTYIMSQLLFDPDPVSNLIQITADGSGNFNYQELPSGDSGSGTYSVADNGAVTIAGEADFNAQLSYDGGVLLIVDTSSDYPHIAVGIRQSSGMSESDLSGVYHLTALGHENMDIDTVFTARGDLTSDGAGAVVYSFPEISDGTSGTDDDTMATSSDGTIATSGGMMGQLSWDGAVFAFPDADSVSDLYLFLVGIRKP